MGGICSGRRKGWATKRTTEDCQSIDVRHWRRDGLLTSHRPFRWRWTCRGEVVSSIHVRPEPSRVVLSYRQRGRAGGWKNESYPVDLDWTPCHLGGYRPWFLCPARGCGRRVAILYSDTIFACRHCYQLAYASQRETWDTRAIRQADRIRERLGWPPGIANGTFLPKPAGMHWSTFDRLIARHDAFAKIAFTGFAAWADRMEESLGIGRHDPQ